MPDASLLSSCARIVRDHDRDRYLCTLFAPASVREDWFALFAFNHEIAAIPESVTEPIMGHIRYAWWREALDEIYGPGPVRRHPVVWALAETIRSRKLARTPFDRLIEARQQDFDTPIPATAESRIHYARATSSTLLESCAAVAGLPEAPSLDTLGVRWALIGQARVDGGLDTEMEKLLKDYMPKKGRKQIPSLFHPFSDMADYYERRLRRHGVSHITRERLGVLLHLYYKSFF